MKIEFRSPIKVNRSINEHPINDLLNEVQKATESDLAPKIKFAKRVRDRMARQLSGAVSHLKRGNEE